MMCEIEHFRKLCLFCFCYLLILFINSVNGRGRMIEPPMRSSMWRFYPWSINPDVKKNTDDGGLNCGGFWRLHGINKGRCGICGDPYDAIQKQNEVGGKYYTGIIVRRYFHGDGYINATIDVQSNIKGYFEFNICPLDRINGTLTRKCLDKYPLTIKGHGRRYVPISDKKHSLKLKIPTNLFCKHCVLRWKWIGGNNWGECSDGYGGLGCGDQTEYYNCADISILSAYDRPKRKQIKKTTTANTVTIIPEMSLERPAPLPSKLRTNFIPKVVPERPKLDIPKKEVQYEIIQGKKQYFKDAGGIIIKPEKILRKKIPDSKKTGTIRITRRMGEAIENPAFGFRWTSEKGRISGSDNSYLMKKTTKQKDVEKSSSFAYETKNSQKFNVLKDDRAIVREDRKGGKIDNIQNNYNRVKVIETKSNQKNDVSNAVMETKFNPMTDVSNIDLTNFMSTGKIEMNLGTENSNTGETLLSETIKRKEGESKGGNNLISPPPVGLSIRNPWKFPQADKHLAVVTESRNENILSVTKSPQRTTTHARALLPPTLPPPSLDAKEQVHLMGNVVQRANDGLNKNRIYGTQILEGNNNINSPLTNANPTEKPNSWPYIDSFITTPSTKNDWSIQSTWMPFLAMEIADGVMPANKVSTSLNSKQFDVTDVRQRGGSISSITGIDNSKRIKGVRHFDEIIDPEAVTPPPNPIKAQRLNPVTRSPMKRATKVFAERSDNMVMSKSFNKDVHRTFTTKATTMPPPPNTQAPSVSSLSPNVAPSIQQKDFFIKDFVLDSSAINTQEKEGGASLQNMPQGGRINTFPRDMPIGKSDSSMSRLSQLTVISV